MDHDTNGTAAATSARPMESVLYEVKKIIVGQDVLLERLAVALLARGHLLVEGVPGLAKTMAIKTLAASIGGEFKRIQFTPDLVPADLDRDPHLQPEDRRVQHVARTGLHQPPARRRDQPGAGQGPVGAARGDAGAPGHDRARDVQGPSAVPRPRDAEPDRDRGHLRPARGPGRPVHAQGPRRLPEPDRGVRHRRTDDRPLDTVSRSSRTDELVALQQAADASTSIRRCTSTRSGWRRRPVTRRTSGCPTSSATSRSGPARGHRST